MMATIIGWTNSFLFAWIFLCKQNPSAYWRSAAVERAQCVATQKLHNALAISDAIIDFLVLIMALPVVRERLLLHPDSVD